MWAERVEGLGYGMRALPQYSVCLVSAFKILFDSSFLLQETLLFVCALPVAGSTRAMLLACVALFLAAFLHACVGFWRCLGGFCLFITNR